MTHLHQQRLMQFLDGLNDTYDQARRQILMKTTEPTLNQAYALITQDESQQYAGGGVPGHKSDPLAMQAGRGQGFRGRKQFMQCEHCHMRGHTKENCYKIVGYPEDFRRRKTYHSKGILTTTNHVEGSVSHEEGNMAQSSQGTSDTSHARGGDHFFTEAQYQQILDLLRDSPPNDIKDLYNGRVKAIGKENEGLYILKRRGIKLLAANVDVRGSSAETTHLWHERLGHASVPVMQHVPFLHNKVDDNMQNKCTYKSETIVFLKQFISMVKTQFDTCVKVVRTDNGKEFFNTQWNEFLLSQGIIHQNCRILNGKSPYGMLYGREPSIAHLRVFGCLCYATNLTQDDKFGARDRQAVHMRDVSFRENEFPFRKMTQHSFTTNDFSSSFLEIIDVQGQPDELPADIGTSSPSEDGNIGLSTETSAAEVLEEPPESFENHDAAVLESVEDTAAVSLTQDGVNEDIQHGEDTLRLNLFPMYQLDSL
ncbi:PREDICTED: uncharacterized protein LOC109228085 [Nicotiana attenuata]|uniref:uncharacterized protein LOC109228085 n=1 Tax=Nicotiana attenuata TaxID=49451 RepID=UPI000904E5B7|nr:PREDICTED: uncharacterized protein LOC109228085 [Nicotiana attenuata]